VLLGSVTHRCTKVVFTNLSVTNNLAYFAEVRMLFHGWFDLCEWNQTISEHVRCCYCLILSVESFCWCRNSVYSPDVGLIFLARLCCDDCSVTSSGRRVGITGYPFILLARNKWAIHYGATFVQSSPCSLFPKIHSFTHPVACLELGFVAFFSTGFSSPPRPRRCSELTEKSRAATASQDVIASASGDLTLLARRNLTNAASAMTRSRSWMRC
jgi:hypothetical protein